MPPYMPALGVGLSADPEYSFSVGPSQFCGGGGAPGAAGGTSTGAELGALVGAAVNGRAAGAPGGAGTTFSGQGAQKTRFPDHGPVYLLQLPATPPKHCSLHGSSLVPATSKTEPSGHVHVPPKLPVLGAGFAALPLGSFSVGPSHLSLFVAGAAVGAPAGATVGALVPPPVGALAGAPVGAVVPPAVGPGGAGGFFGHSSPSIPTSFAA